MFQRPLLFAALAVLAAPLYAAERYVAITIDDLPYQRGNSLAEIQGLTDKLVEQIRAHKAPVAVFVNEGKLHDGGEQELKARTALLEQWLDAGAELGNHTYSHAEINNIALDVYERDILRGEEISKQLLSKRGKALTYFRHPYLHTGQDAKTRAALAEFLREHHYIVAPVTIDNDEWIYAAAYDKAAEQKDEATMRRIGADYLTYMNQAFAFSEHVAQQLFSRDIKHTLLIHSNALNAQYYDELIDMMKKRGYEFVSLSAALEDDAYRSEDQYVGPKGLSWLFRWGVGQELDTSKAPEIPTYVRELSGT
jgi:peptidoglycan/xylan/chitin deacetylase (PgdA/CDA1 family)